MSSRKVESCARRYQIFLCGIWRIGFWRPDPLWARICGEWVFQFGPLQIRKRCPRRKG